ncbi:MAG: hypothetical protein JWM88_557 [Verrucomicrobia bacterium]|nr:hypothetical protein [Verrucomicrobiota bacterium]
MYPSEPGLRNVGAGLIRSGTLPTRRSCQTVFLILFGIGIVWSFYTKHVWEDFYITYRASKNLATGNGLTFTVGERVHSFTSPLGVLLPALASVLTGNRSDTAALWIFRLLSIATYAGAGVILWQMARRLFADVWPAVFLVVLFATDAKTIDFTVNGMETPYVLFFLSWTLAALFLSPPRQALHLGLSWAGLMWSRPDSFIYIGAISVGALLFLRFTPFWLGRWRLLKNYLLGGAITTVLYLPWLLWAWWYYGSPVPHTVIAKGLLLPKANLSAIIYWLKDFPGRIIHTGASLGTTFMPPYGEHSGWPEWAVRISFYLALAILVTWLVPFVRREARVASFGFFVGHFYLNYIANFHSPWYVPTVTLLAFVALAGILDSLLQGVRQVSPESGADATPRRRHPLLIGIPLLIPLGAFALFLCTAYEMRMSQMISETGNRRKIGEWLHANASPKDTVFLECLGYIGFFSNLKMYDFPGLCSPEVVAVRLQSPTKGDYVQYFPELITALHPDWLVLRSSEVSQVDMLMPDILNRYYQRVQTFDVRDKVAAVRFLPGRPYLDFDARFEVFHRNWDPAIENGPYKMPGHVIPISIRSLVTNQTWAGPAINSKGNITAHAPSVLATLIPKGVRSVSGRFGFFPGSYEKERDSTSGAIFTVSVIDAARAKTVIFRQVLTPHEETSQRGDQPFAADLPAGDHPNIEFAIDPLPGKSNAYGWTYWSNLKFEFAHRK